MSGDRLLDEVVAKIAPLPIAWGGIFEDNNYTFWPRLQRKCPRLFRPAGNLLVRPSIAWQAMSAAGLTVNDFMDVLKDENVPAHRQCSAELSKSDDLDALAYLILYDRYWPEFERICDLTQASPPKQTLADVTTWLRLSPTYSSLLGKVGRELKDQYDWSRKWTQARNVNLENFYEELVKIPEAVAFFQLTVAKPQAVQPVRCTATSYGEMNQKERAEFWSFAQSILVEYGLSRLLKTPGVLTSQERSWIQVDQYGGLDQPSFADWLRQHLEDKGQPFLQAIGCVLERKKDSHPVLYDVVASHYFAPLFGLGATAPNEVPHSKPLVSLVNETLPAKEIEELSGKQYLRSRLSSEFYDAEDTDQDKDDHIESVLRNPAINRYLRTEVGWLLPEEDSTLWDLFENGHAKWAPLIAALVEVAERGLGEVDTTFPVLNHRKAVEDALKISADLPLLEVLIYNPKMKSDKRMEEWRSTVSKILNQAQLLKWLGKPSSMVGKQLSQKQMDRMLDRLMEKVDQDKALRAEVLAACKPKLKSIADLDGLVAELFSTTPDELPELTFSKPSGWAATFLQGLKIDNPTLEEHLREMEDDLSMFALKPKKKWPAELVRWGATGTQNLKVTAALAAANLIH